MKASEKGREGEDLAAAHLAKNRYKILERNFRARHGEIDIIAKHKGVLVFVEVKMRASGSFGGPADAVNRAKQRKISMAALEYLSRTKQTKARARFDVVCVKTGENGAPRVEIIRNAFRLAYP
ncbi:MAG: YraN family protein [Deltaproteobacteria bacterium]|nr:YraN family protein [Deltaproteobacteria bacterium]